MSSIQDNFGSRRPTHSDCPVLGWCPSRAVTFLENHDTGIQSNYCRATTVASKTCLYALQYRSYRQGIDNVLVLLIGGIPIAMPTVFSVTMAIGSHRLLDQGAITKRMTAIEEMAGMDIPCSDKTGTLTLNKLTVDNKTGTLTLNKLTVDKGLIEVFSRDMDKDTLVLYAARAKKLAADLAWNACT